MASKKKSEVKTNKMFRRKKNYENHIWRCVFGLIEQKQRSKAGMRVNQSLKSAVTRLISLSSLLRMPIPNPGKEHHIFSTRKAEERESLEFKSSRPAQSIQSCNKEERWQEMGPEGRKKEREKRDGRECVWKLENRTAGCISVVGCLPNTARSWVQSPAQGEREVNRGRTCKVHRFSQEESQMNKSRKWWPTLVKVQETYDFVSKIIMLNIP